MSREISIIGGGAAGFFCALNIATENEDVSIRIFEKTSNLLSKVKVSGGGRCNVTHACFDPKELVENYPRGKKELLGPFHRFQPGDTIAWFDERGVELKTEEDGRMFPISDSSQTIIDCFLGIATQKNIQISTSEGVEDLYEKDGKWHLKTKNEVHIADDVFMSAGSSKVIWNMLKGLGHKIIPPVASLFTFNIQEEALNELAGVSFSDVVVSIPEFNHSSSGSMLITHWGISGPAVLKSSSVLARELFDKDYEFMVKIDLLAHMSYDMCIDLLEDTQFSSQKLMANHSPFTFPKRFWHYLLNRVSVSEGRKWSDLRKVEKLALANELKNLTFEVKGKSTFKEEFVTAGGVSLKEVNFKTMESKLLPNLYFGGEVLNIDAVTGGFNFQAAWTTAYIAARSILKKD